MVQTSVHEGKLFKEIEFQILMRKIDIKNLEKSIDKSFKLAGVNGPKGTEGLGVDYSRVISTTPEAHIGLEDAIRLAARDSHKIEELKKEISEYRSKKKNLIKIMSSLDGIKEKVFYQRIIMQETQETAADNIGLSKRQLQRIENELKASFTIFLLQKK